MPNYCLNRATLRHRDPAQLKRLLKAYSRGGPGVGQEFLPPPADCDERTWRICYWGTKWDFGEETFGRAAESVHGVVRLDFDTANTPPLGIYLELLRQGFEVEAMNCEMGQQFLGRVDGDDIRHFTINSSDIRQIVEHVDEAMGELAAVSSALTRHFRATGKRHPLVPRRDAIRETMRNSRIDAFAITIRRPKEHSSGDMSGGHDASA